MSKYFISVYKNYLNKIESDKSIENNCKNLINKVTLVNTSFNNYSNYIDNSLWQETSKNTISSSYLPRIKENCNLLTNGIVNNLSKVISLVKNDLYDMLVELKNKDDDYCELQDKLKMEQMGSQDTDYIKEKLKVMDKILIDLVKNIDNKILEIKSYNDLSNTDGDVVASLAKPDLGLTKDELLKLYKNAHKNNKEDGIIGKLKYQIEENKINKLLNGKSETDSIISSSDTFSELDNPNCTDLSLLNENWKVINTPRSISEYAVEAYNRGIRQNSNPEKYGDYCLAFSYVHASNLHKGEIDAGAENAYKWNHAGEFYDFFSDNKQETLKTVFNQIKEGNPVIMQVNGNSKGTTRHFVTVVGINSNVKNADSVTESDLLILDSWDGKLEKMGTTGSRFMTTGKQTNKSYSGYYLRLLK